MLCTRPRFLYRQPRRQNTLSLSQHRTRVCTSVANGTAPSLSCILQNAGEEGSAKLANIIGCGLPRQRPGPFRPLQAPKVQSECSPLVSQLLFKSDVQSSKSFTTFLKASFTVSVQNLLVRPVSSCRERGCSISLVKQSTTRYMYAA
jgi:hypothetical protein